MNKKFLKEVVEPAWELTNKAEKIKKFYFFPSLLSTIYIGIIILYQTAFGYIEVFDKQDEFFNLVLVFFHNDYFILSLIVFISLFLIYFLSTPITESALMNYIKAYDTKNINNYKTSYVIGQGTFTFTKLWEYYSITAMIRILSIITSYIFAIRLFGSEYFNLISIIYAIYILIAIFINIFFSYAKFYIALEGKNVIGSIGASIQASFSNAGDTFRLFFSVMILYFRIIITAILFILFPIITSIIFTYITSQIFIAISFIFIGIIFISFILFVTYINTVVGIFVTSMWYFAYKKFKEQEKIEEGEI